MPHHESVTDLLTHTRLIVLVDLAGFAKAFQSKDDLQMAALLRDFYGACASSIAAHGGTIIKFIGDACLATFDPEHATDAVQAVAQVQEQVEALAKLHQVPIALGANLHLAPVVEGTFGERRDIIGRGVNQTFMLGGGAGVRLSEPAYRALPSAARSPWTKHKPPAVYHLERGTGILEGLGKSAGTNAARW